jgi:membrane-associated protease RseP (regulator of RpoE activity)
MRARYGALIGVVVLGVLVAIGMANPAALGAIGVLVFFFVVMIGFHELGHFVFAKRAGMKVSEFFIGFGPRLWSVRRGETEYGIKALPLGGYCKIIGMTNIDEVDAADEPRTFRRATLGGKVSTLVAGPASHFVLALLLIFCVLAFGGDVFADHVKPTTVVGAVTAGSPADTAGLRPGDRIVFLAGTQIRSWDQATKLIRDNPGRAVAIEVVRANHEVRLQAELGRRTDTPTQGFLGVAPHVAYAHPSVVGAVSDTPARLWESTRATVGAIGSMFSPSGLHSYVQNFSNAPAKTQQQQDQRNSHRFISPVGLGKVAYDTASAGWVDVFLLLISINIFVGLLNLVPLIPFDGGHLAVAGYEALMSRIRRRRVVVDFHRLMPIAVATLTVLAFIFLSSVFLDIAHPLKL